MFAWCRQWGWVGGGRRFLPGRQMCTPERQLGPWRAGELVSELGVRILPLPLPCLALPPFAKWVPVPRPVSPGGYHHSIQSSEPASRPTGPITSDFLFIAQKQKSSSRGGEVVGRATADGGCPRSLLPALTFPGQGAAWSRGIWVRGVSSSHGKSRALRTSPGGVP